ncbi:MAG: ATP-binding protein [Bacteroidales bacterium]|nr:ATP-binding protein [Bacteroidales bacterium]
MISRTIEKTILNDFHNKKVVALFGPRQVGKTTLLESLIKPSDRFLQLNCDNFDDAMRLEDKTTTELKEMLGEYDIVLIDEAQRVKDIGLTLKKIGDLKMQTQVIATGSSSFDLANGIYEPATGRLIEYMLYPFSLRELADNSSERDQQRLLETRMIYGTYPDVVTSPANAKRTLMSLTNNYLYKDILSYKGIKKPEFLQKLVRALALQVGSEVSYNELSNLLGIDKETVENYIGLLEKCFVVFRLDSYSRNMRNEIKKGKKVYFYDNGIRNAAISNFAPLDYRDDAGVMWENLMVSERKKRNAYCGSYAQMYFWRTHDQKEVDLIEIEDGKMNAFEFKWSPSKKASAPKLFAESYPDAQFITVTPANMWSFV